MIYFGRFIAKHRKWVLAIAILLCIPALYGYLNTPINYDLLEYLPDEFDSVKGQNLLNDTFSSGSLAFLMMDNATDNEAAKFKEEIESIDGVKAVLWRDDLFDITMPKEFLPEEIQDVFYSDKSTMMAISFKEASAADNTQEALTEIKNIMDERTYLSGMAALLKDTKDLADRQTPFYVGLAVLLAVIVLALTMESTLIPIIFLLGIGMAILYNMGTNMFLGHISYVTNSLAAVLQLGVTMDYSIFLLHRFDEERLKYEDQSEAMAQAISKTFASVAGSSLTTIAGFLALGFMKFGIGKDIGLVMAKGVLFGIITTLTILPAMILIMEKPLYRFRHKTLLPTFEGSSKRIVKRRNLFLILFLILIIPAVLGNDLTEVYYNIDSSLPRTMDSVKGLDKLKDEYNMTSTHIIMISDTVSPEDTRVLINDLKALPGIEKVIGLDALLGSRIPRDMIPEDLISKVQKGGYKMIVANSSYSAASDELKAQLAEMDEILKAVDENALVAGEGALTNDLIEICDIDFKNVSIASIVAIAAIVLLIFMSVSIPILLVGAIEIAILINMAIPFYMGSTIPFIATIVIGTVQLGTTVDYAILLTTRFREEIRNGHERHLAMQTTLKGTMRSIVTSALTFFAATIGVYFISDIAMIKTLTLMIARGALISMLIIVCILPALLMFFEPVVAKTSRNWRTLPKIIQKAKARKESERSA